MKLYRILLCALLLLPSFTLRSFADDDVRIELDVQESKAQSGSAEDGYRVDNVKNFGPWGDKVIKDIPSTITVIPEEMIHNTNARSSEELFKLNPLVNTRNSFDINNITELNSRGFSTKRINIDGVQTDNLGLGVFVEDVDSVEILNGLSGFMFGAGNLGGVANFNLKRPADVHNLTIGDYGGGQDYVHADFGGLIGKRYGYRINAMYQNGDTPIEQQLLKRELLSGAFDIYASKDLTIQLNASYGAYYLDGRQTQFWTGSDNMPGMLATMDTKKLWGPDGTYNNVKTLVFGGGVKYDINKSLSTRVSYLHKEDDRGMLYTTTADIVDYNTAYEYSLMGSRDKYVTDGGYAYLDSKFNTGSIKHKVTAGMNGYYQTIYQGVFYNPDGSVTSGYTNYPQTATYKFDIDDPNADYVVVPDWDVDNAPLQRTTYFYNSNFILGDDIEITDRFGIMAGMNYSVMNQLNYHPITGQFSSNYNKKALTPTLSFIFKPTKILTTYVSYMQALERGQIVASTYKNAGATLPPLISNQYEAGVKANIGGVQASAAVFYIEKPYQYSEDGTLTGKYVQDGREVHKGFELTLMGRVMDRLNILAGGTIFNADIEKSNEAALEGKKPIYTPELLSKLYAEYDTPLKGLTVTGGVYYTGKSYANNYNTTEIGDYATLDAGLRYTTTIMKRKTKFIFNVSNLTGEDYWVGQTLGSPRTVSFSASVDF